MMCCATRLFGKRIWGSEEEDRPMLIITLLPLECLLSGLLAPSLINEDLRIGKCFEESIDADETEGYRE